MTRIALFLPLSILCACPLPDGETSLDTMTVADTSAGDTGECLAGAPYGPCPQDNGGCAPDVCVQTDSGKVCARPALDASACASVPCLPSGGAVVYENGWCMLSCGDGSACPDGMVCDPKFSWCVHP